LRRYPHLVSSIPNMQERIDILSDKFRSIKSARADATPVSGGTSTAEDAWINNIVERDRLAENIRVVRRLIELINKGLSALDEREYRVLELFYIDRQPNHVERLMDELGYEQRQIYRLRDQALYKFTIGMYGLTEL
jgi:hypothetical protein